MLMKNHHDDRAERSVIGAMLIDERAAKVALEATTVDAFYVGRNRAAFEVAAAMLGAGRKLDDLTFEFELQSHGWTKDDVRKYIGDVMMDTPTAANVEEYCATINECTALRNLEKAAVSFHQSISARHSSKEILERLKEELATISPRATDFDFGGVRPINIQDLLNYDFENDPTVLIEGGWMTKGGVYGVVGQTGIGKSSFLMQMTLSFAAGQALFGLRPVRPLKCVIIQGENSTRVLAREAIGIFGNVPNASTWRDTACGRVVIYSEARFSGQSFHRLCRWIVEQHHPEIVLLDPWYSFLGGDVNNQVHVSAWIRNGLMPLAFQHGTAFVIAHHTPKPVRDSNARAAYSGSDWSYFGAGSAEFANACRGILTLREINAELFELRAAKSQEGPPLRESDEDGAPAVRACYIQHGVGGIYWRRPDADALAAIQDETTEEVKSILQIISGPSADGRGWRYTPIIKLIEHHRNCKTAAAKSFFRRHLKPELTSTTGIYSVRGFKDSTGFKQDSASGMDSRIHTPEGG